jgi:hypothetical protein
LIIIIKFKLVTTIDYCCTWGHYLTWLFFNDHDLFQSLRDSWNQTLNPKVGKNNSFKQHEWIPFVKCEHQALNKCDANGLMIGPRIDDSPCWTTLLANQLPIENGLQLMLGSFH